MSDTKIIAEPGKQEIIITRTVDAPRDLVFKAFIDPQAIPQWWGPRRLTTQIDKLEARPGGSWRFVQRDKEGNEFAFHGVFHEVKAPEMAIQTFEFEGVPGHVSLETMILKEENGKTLITAISVFQSVEDRDGMVQAGMESGVREGYERLDELLAKTSRS
ncbi:MAG: SRPBCC family protein [Chloroflexia bacterium]